jgi:hypothetical protein
LLVLLNPNAPLIVMSSESTTHVLTRLKFRRKAEKLLSRGELNPGLSDREVLKQEEILCNVQSSGKEIPTAEVFHPFRFAGKLG